MTSTPDARNTASRTVWMAAAVLALALAAGCGKKDDPKPPDADATYPKAYPEGAPKTEEDKGYDSRSGRY